MTGLTYVLSLGTGGIAAIAVGVFLLLNVVFGIVSTLIGARIAYHRTMVRENKEMWSRECSDPDPEQVEMYETGIKWAEEHRSAIKELHLVNEGLHLYAEYSDLGYDRAVIIVPGRTEGLRYGYYFASPYAKNGYNVLCIDQRAHGKSDGRYNCIGFDEHRDLLRWAELLHTEYGIRSIVLHGICIGAACSLYALTSENAPSYFAGLVADGMYPNFYESYKNHMIEQKKPWRIIPVIEFWMKRYTGYTMRKGPINVIGGYEKPLLMLHGTGDLYSVPSEAERLLAACGSTQKQIIWFAGGRHSRLRLTDTERYDGAVEAFLAEIREKEAAVR